MLIRNLRRPGDYARAVIAQKDQLRLEIANDNRIAKIRQNQKFGVVETPEQEKDLAERIGDENQRRQTAFDNLSQIFTAEQVDRFMPLLDDATFQFLNLYWKDMKAELTKKANTKLMDEFFFKNYLDKYIGTIMNQKGLNAPVGTQSSVNEIPELQSLFQWRDEAEKAAERMKSIDSGESKKLRELISLVPNKRRLQRINTLNDADKQRVIEGIAESFSGIDPRPEEWRNAIAERDGVEFYFAITKLYKNMRNDEMETAQTINDLLDAPPATLGQAEAVPLAEEDTSFIAESRLKSAKPPKGLSAEASAEEPAEPKGTPAEEKKKAKKGPEAKKGPPEAKPVEGQAEGKVAVARVVNVDDYISPDEYNALGKGKQNDYMSFLSKVLKDSQKLQLFGRNDKGKVRPVSYYNDRTIPDEELRQRRKRFAERLADYDDDIQKRIDDPVGTGMKRKPGRPKSGKGIASTCKEQTPRWIELGRYRINGRLLDEKQLLSVRYQSGTAVPQFPKMIPISDSFHELLTNLFETKKLDKRLMKELDPEEQRSAEVLLVKSGVGRGFGIKEITPTNEEQKKIKRFEVVKGSYLAGNNSKDVIHELRSLIIHFVTTGHLSRKEGLRTLVELQ
jgi:hypothetical protein